jgi:hypothetical protein
MAKASTNKSATAQKISLTRAGAVRPVKEVLTKSALIDLVAAQNDLPRKTAAAVYATLEGAFLGSVHPRGVGEFTLPGLLKVSLRKVPARRAGTLVRNPGTGNGQGIGETGECPRKYSRLIKAQNSSRLPIDAALRTRR